tara:strand:+ start:617 stop:1003 length:387 start_codon:yes stop_codon:yes gene_type:complete
MATNRYIDLDLDFKKHPVTKDIVVLKDENAVKRAVRNIVLLNHYDVRFHPEIGTGIRSLLFSPVSPIHALNLQKLISDAIKNFEPRAELSYIEVVARLTHNEYTVNIEFRVINTTEPIALTLALQRIR